MTSEESTRAVKALEEIASMAAAIREAIGFMIVSYLAKGPSDPYAPGTPVAPPETNGTTPEPTSEQVP